MEVCRAVIPRPPPPVNGHRDPAAGNSLVSVSSLIYASVHCSDVWKKLDFVCWCLRREGNNCITASLPTFYAWKSYLVMMRKMQHFIWKQVWYGLCALVCACEASWRPLELLSRPPFRGYATKWKRCFSAHLSLLVFLMMLKVFFFSGRLCVFCSLFSCHFSLQCSDVTNEGICFNGSDWYC